MFTRVVEVTCKPGKARDLCKAINDKVLPILKKQNGFSDELTLVSHSDSDRVLAISFWKSREDAERYQREQFDTVTDLINPYLEDQPTVETYDVDTSTSHRISSGKAA